MDKFSEGLSKTQRSFEGQRQHRCFIVTESILYQFRHVSRSY